MAAAALTLTACGGGETGESGGEVSDGSGETETSDGGDAELAEFAIATASRGIAFLPFFVGIQAGIYEEHGLEVTMFDVAGGTPGMAALESGDVQFFSGLPESGINPRAAGSEVVIVMGVTQKNDYKIVAHPDIESLQDLEGKRVGILNEGNGTHTLQQWLLDHEGVGHENVTFVASGGISDRLSALTADQIEATILNTPLDMVAESQGYHVIADYIDYEQAANYPNQVVLALPSVLESRPDEVRSFLAATIEASNWIYENPDEAYEIALEWTSIEADLLEPGLNDFIEKEKFTRTGEIDMDGLEWSLGVVRQYTDQPVPDDAQELLDLSYLP